MPLLQPPGPDLRPSELTYTHAYSSIVSRVRRSGGPGSGGVVIFCGVDVVRFPSIPSWCRTFI
jgi:cell division control protein 45